MTTTKEELLLAETGEDRILELFHAIERAIRAVDAAGDYAMDERPSLIACVKAYDWTNFDHLPEWAKG